MSHGHTDLCNAISKICFDSLNFCIKASRRLSSGLQEPPGNDHVFTRSRIPYSRSVKVWYLTTSRFIWEDSRRGAATYSSRSGSKWVMDLRFSIQGVSVRGSGICAETILSLFFEVWLLALERWPSGSKACCTIVRAHITIQESHRCLWLYLWWSDNISLMCWICTPTYSCTYAHTDSYMHTPK